jgi:trimeric autotransporter adhesin
MLKKTLGLLIFFLFGLQADLSARELAPLQSILNPDGSLNLKTETSGSFDPKGYVMKYGRTGEPIFQRSTPLSNSRGNEQWSARFQGPPGVSNLVYAVAVNGQDVYVGGAFRISTGQIVVNHVAKWNGSSWSALGSGMNGGVDALAWDGGNLYVGGAFTEAGDKYSSYIAKWSETATPTPSMTNAALIMLICLTGSMLWLHRRRAKTPKS